MIRVHAAAAAAVYTGNTAVALYIPAVYWLTVRHSAIGSCVYMYVHTHIDTWYTLVLLVLEYLYSSCTTAAVLQQLYYSSSTTAAVL